MIRYHKQRINPRRLPAARSASAAAAGLLAAAIVMLPIAPGALAEQPAPLDATGIAPDNLPGSFADLVEAVSPAVVNISTTSTVKLPQGMTMPNFELPEGSPLEDMLRPFFEQFGGTPGEERKTNSLGSGFLIGPEGYVVTNNHVIKDADEIEVILNDGRKFAAEVRGTDEKTDLALLKIDNGEHLPYLRFGDSEAARVGDWVIAIGNPFGLGGTTTTGIISARGRNINAGPYDDFIQVDAPINRGNSGGPLFNASGEVIGVNTAIFSPSGGSVGIGFAIPSSIAKDVIVQLKESGVVERGWLGVQIQLVSEDLAEGLGLDEAAGALVASVIPDSPAADAGIEAGDVILEFDGQAVTEMRELPRLVASVRAGKSVPVKVWRNGTEQVLQAEIRATSDAPAELASSGKPAAGKPAKLGLALEELTPENRARFDLPKDAGGVLVTAVEPGSPAAGKGIRPGDLILRVGNSAVTTPEQVIKAVDEARAGERKAVVFLIRQGDDNRFVALQTE